MAKHEHKDGHHFKHHMGHMAHRAEGGKVEPYDADGSNVEKEAEEKKHGGKVKERRHPRKRGGKAEQAVEGKKEKRRLDRPCRAKGGRVGADKSPLTAAANTKDPEGHKTAEED